MRLYQEFPYLNECTVTVTERKTVGGKPHVVTNRTIFYPGAQETGTMTLGYFDQIPVSKVYEEGGKIYHVLEEKTRKNSLVQKLDWKSRLDIMQQSLAAVLYALAIEKLYSIPHLSTKSLDEETVMDFDIQGLSLDYKQLCQTAMEIVNTTIQNGLEVDRITEETGQFIQIPSLGKMSMDAPSLSNTAELVTSKILSYQVQQDVLRIHMIAGERCMDYVNQRLSTFKELRQLLETDDGGLTIAIRELLAENEQLRTSNAKLKGYVYADYIKKVNPPTSTLGEYSITNLLVEDPNLENIYDLVERFPSNIVMLTMDQGEFSEIAAIHNIEDFSLDEVFDAVKEIYPFELELVGSVYKGRILTQYLERFREHFEKYLEERLTAFIEHPPQDEQLMLDPEGLFPEDESEEEIPEEE
ncbi:MAG: hypothetical protein Q4G61_06615 [Tissierellia bacterium]|nr:hypothetical protein [Tissierellia bacterium]